MDDDLDLRVRPGERAVGPDLAARRVLLEQVHPLGFDGLVIARGAALVNPWEGRRSSGVHALRTLSDSLALRDAFSQAERLVVIGAGSLAAEVASVAQQCRLPVTMIERRGRGLRRDL